MKRERKGRVVEKRSEEKQNEERMKRTRKRKEGSRIDNYKYRFTKTDHSTDLR